jgi:tyrosinase-like protein
VRVFDLPSGPVDTFDWLMAATTHSDFSQRCWRVHDNLHVWVGGEMSDPNWAAFDPLFWRITRWSIACGASGSTTIRAPIPALTSSTGR